MGGSRSGRPNIRVLDWWTGRYAVDIDGMRAHSPGPGTSKMIFDVQMGIGEAARAFGRSPSKGRREMRDAAAAAAWRAHPRMTSTKSAKEQLASARARVARRQQAAMSRAGYRSERFSAGPNIGVGFAVIALLVVVGIIVARAMRIRDSAAGHQAATMIDRDESMHIPLRIVTSTDERTVDLVGDPEMLLINEDEPIMEVLVTDAGGDTIDSEAAPAAFLPRLLAGPNGMGHVAFVWDRSSLDADHISTVHAVADLLEDGGATLIGYDDRKEDIDAAARMRQIIGVSGIDDPGVRSSLREWLTTNGIMSLVYVERDAPWVLIDTTGNGLSGAIDHATEVPTPTFPATAAPPATPGV